MKASIPQIAAACGVAERTARNWAKRPEWPAGTRSGLGGALMFDADALPVEVRIKGTPVAVRAPVRNALLMLMQAHTEDLTLPATAPAVALPAVKPAAGLSLQSLAAPDSGQLDTERARDRLLAFIEAFDGSTPRAIEHLNAHRFAGTLPSPLAWAYDHAWDKKRRDSHLNLDTLNKWKATKKKRGRSAPLRVLPDASIKPWMLVAFDLARHNPQGRTKKWIHEQLVAQWQAEWGAAPISYDVLATFFRQKVSALDQIKGKWTGSQLRARTFYQHRTSKGMQPWDEIHADGWNTHFTAPHPVTAEYVTYEVWHAHDVATRYVPPFGIGLTENFEVIAKCVENAVRAGGVPMFLQTDSTRIVKLSEKFKTNPATAIADRAGFTIVHPQTVGNSQANGIAENFNTWLDRESRELATYQNPNRMDELSFKRGRKLTAAMVKAAKSGDVATMHAKRHELERTNRGLVLTSFEQAIAWLEDKRSKWNHKPHRALPKTARDEHGRLRHQTPFEAIMSHIEAGWKPSLPDLPDEALEQHLIDLFRPHVQLKVTRGTVSPYGGMRYRHDALDEYIGKDVVVAYDMTDWRQVWVKTMKGEPICIAAFVEATGYRTLSAQEAADEKRTQARIRNKERQIEAERLATPTPVIEHRSALLDYLPAKTAPVIVEDVRLIDLLPARQPEEARELTYMETVALYMRRDGDGDVDDAPKESAAG